MTALTSPPAHCTIVPPHVLERLAQHDDPEVHGPARYTLELDAAHRTRRRVRPSPTPPEGVTAASDQPQRTIDDARHHQFLPGHAVRTEGGPPSADPSVNQAYDGLGNTFELYLNAYARHSVDGAGLPLVASVHYGRAYNNAFWNGEQMVFGDGDGRIFGPFTGCTDIIGHELTHGVTQYTAALDYYGQPGALNESVSDVFGSIIKQFTLRQTVDQADWLIGAGLLLPGVHGVALRSMKAPGTAYDDPALGKDPQPATMSAYQDTMEDNGGVHINSGIPNHAFYLLATALGGRSWERAGRIWYDALTGGHLPSSADFAAFARVTAAAALARFGEGAEHRAVLDAWAKVGVNAAAAAAEGTQVPRQGAEPAQQG